MSLHPEIRKEETPVRNIRVVLQCYSDAFDPQPPNNWRPEVTIDDVRLLPDYRSYGPSGCIPREKAEKMAQKLADALDVEVEGI
jgi:hypothetical protein